MVLSTGDVRDLPKPRIGEGPELFFGLVSPIGVDNTSIVHELRKGLLHLNYAVQEISLIGPVLALTGQSIPDVPLNSSYAARMTAGNDFRRSLGRNDAVALGALAAIRSDRQDSADTPRRIAYVLRSLKTPEEATLLRTIYGSNFFLIAAYAPRDGRAHTLAKRIADSVHDPHEDRYRGDAYDLINRDEREHGVPFGQNLSETFPLADVFVDASDSSQLRKDLQRFLDLVFQHPFKTPTRAESGMFQAFAAGLRSSSPARQVGAAITNDAGDVIAVGSNEVPKAFGGQYWADDPQDHRDHTRRTDSNRLMIRNILADIMERLNRLGWLSTKYASMDAESRLSDAEAQLTKALTAHTEDPPSLRDRAYLFGLLEFLRAVHAEMAALMTAARLGTATKGCTLYATTFPCHECARHIVAAGIHRVEFIEPYPKSRVPELYDDSICLDSEEAGRVPFVAYRGVAPRSFVLLFRAPTRQLPDGTLVEWDAVKGSQIPRNTGSVMGYQAAETDHIDLLNKLLHASTLFPEDNHGKS